MKTFLKSLLIVLGIFAIACLVILIIAQTKDMTFIDLLKDWFSKKETVETTETVARLMHRG